MLTEAFPHVEMLGERMGSKSPSRTQQIKKLASTETQFEEGKKGNCNTNATTSFEDGYTNPKMSARCQETPLGMGRVALAERRCTTSHMARVENKTRIDKRDEISGQAAGVSSPVFTVAYGVALASMLIVA